MAEQLTKGWTRVTFADELPECHGCGEAWCPKHKMHFADCECIGPTMDGYEYMEHEGVLYARLENTC